ncbi:MAG: DegT/DnrJ/EryC1/StrS family aminotransferase [Bacteroidia bacterium]|nr:DegT/DnrJ/EryC1/StrS family aminotransferase [Bacteroidia bacterium]
MPVNMDRLNEIATKYNLKVIEDCALAIGSYFNNKHVGLHGDFGCFSFYPVKHMTTAEGGMLISKNVESGEKIQRQKAFGVDRNMTERTVPGVYDVTMLGYNYRMNEIQAALGIEQLKRLPDFLNKRRENYEVLSAGLKDIEEIYTFQSSFDNYQSSYYCFSAILNDQLASKRVEIVNVLKENGIGTSVYYPKPVPYFTYYKEKYNYAENDFPNASKISNNSISLPVGPHLDHDDMTYIIDTIKDTIYKFK